MAWHHQATSHYLRQYWPRSTSPYGVTRPQWVNGRKVDITVDSYEKLWSCLLLHFYCVIVNMVNGNCLSTRKTCILSLSEHCILDDVNVNETWGCDLKMMCWSKTGWIKTWESYFMAVVFFGGWGFAFQLVGAHCHFNKPIDPWKVWMKL